MGRNEGSALFGGAVDIGRDELAVPMELLGSVGFVVNVDGDGLSFFEAKQRAGKLSVVSREDTMRLGAISSGLVAMVSV